MKSLSFFPLFILLACEISYGDGFNIQYIDKKGLQWSQKIGPFTNGCVDPQGKQSSDNCARGPGGEVVVSDSKAALACLQLDSQARLPTFEEVKQVVREFDYYEVEHGPVLTSEGLKNFRKAIGGEPGTYFWTSTVATDDAYAYSFITYRDGICGDSGNCYAGPRWFGSFVVCVRNSH